MLNSDQIATIALVAIGSSALVILTALRYWFRSRMGAPSKDAGQQLRRLEDRLLQTQQAIDAIAVEVERISEGQRFTTKLLAEREENGVRTR